MIRPGEEWGQPTTAEPDLEVEGGDADLAEVVAGRPGVLVRFRPDPSSDFAGAVGLGSEASAPLLGIEMALDLLQIVAGGEGGAADPALTRSAVNMVVMGTSPDTSRRFVQRFVATGFSATVCVDGREVFAGRCTAVVVAGGQFRRGLDLVPRGHPGDGRAEVQVYAVPARQQRALRARLATGTHVPHPNITQRSGAKVSVRVDRRVPLEIDGRPAPASDRIEIEVVPNAFRLLL